MAILCRALYCTAFDCRIQAGNGGKLSCSQAELTQTIKAAVDMFASISCQYPEIEGGMALNDGEMGTPRIKPLLIVKLQQHFIF